MISQPANIAAQYLQIAQRFPELPAVISEVTVITHGQMLAAAISFAKHFKSQAVDRQSIVAINTGDTASAIAVLMATSFLGCKVVTASEILRKQAVVEPTHFYRTADAKGKQGVGFVLIDETWFLRARDVRLDEALAFEGYASADDVWQILHTSGTTGKPKFIGLSHQMVSDRTAAIVEDFPLGQTTCAILFNSTSRPFFARAIGAMLNACAIVDSSDANFWKRCGVDTVFCSPSQYRSFVKKYGKPPMLQKIEVSGAKLDDDMARLMSQSFRQIVDIYGASETNKTFANLVKVDRAGLVTRVGKPLDTVIEIVDDFGNPRPQGEAGTVRVKNPYMAAGYINSPEATAKNFRDGWFYPGDLARFGENGELDVLGRNDDIISFGGIKIDAQLIDLIIQNVPGVKDAICFKNPKADRNEVTAFVVFDGTIDRVSCTERIRQEYEANTRLPCFLGRIHQIDQIPYSEDGRPMRELCQKMIIDISGHKAGA